MTKHYSYASLLRQREFMAALTLGLVVVMTGVGLELALTSQRNTIDPKVLKLIEPLDPLLDLKTVQTLESYQQLSLTTAKEFVQDKARRAAVIVEQDDGLPPQPGEPIQIGAPAQAPIEQNPPDTQIPAAEAQDPDQLLQGTP